MANEPTEDAPFDYQGLLSEKQRRYLFGDLSYDDAGDESSMRQRIRNRVVKGFLDFNLLANYLESRDRRLIFEQLVEGTKREEIDEARDDPQGWKELRHREFAGLLETVSFIYAGIMEQEMGFIESDKPEFTLIELAVKRAEQDVSAGSICVPEVELTYTPAIVSYDIANEIASSTPSIAERVETGGELTPEETQALIQLLANDTGQFIDYLSPLDVDIEEDFRNDGPLSIASSFQFLYSILSGTGEVSDNPNIKQIHEGVLQELRAHPDAVGKLGLTNEFY